MSQKLFSIIVATYNCGRKIEPTIQSILSQNKDLFELIVVDGASSDDTLQYIKKYENDLTLISEKDGGIYYAFNKGIDLATGKYLYFIGAGDALRENVLKSVSELLPPEENLAFVYGDIYFNDREICETGARSRTTLVARAICHQTIFYQRGIFDLLGKYDLRYKILADLAFNIKCFGSRQIKKHYIPRVIANFEGGGVSDTGEDADFQRDLPRLIKNNLGVKPYIYYKARDAYWKWYFPFVRPYVRAFRQQKDAGR